MNTIMDRNQEFQKRHIGPRSEDIKNQLKALGFQNLEELLSKVIPSNIRTQKDFPSLGKGQSEDQALATLKKMMAKNRVAKSYIGMGFHDCITPSVIQRNVLENPLWYTAYTPYQPEISQGRLEALLNFQTMVCELTGMELSNASLLDEGTAAAEAMAMAHSLSKNKSDTFLVSSTLHPHVIEVLKTRSEALGLHMKVMQNLSSGELPQDPVFAAILSYPDTEGNICDWTGLTKAIQAQGGLVIADVDLLSLSLLTPPGEWGADLVVGNSQRFGVPLGNGGPHAAFMACRDAYKRLLPGRLVGVSVDSRGQRALRLTLQTREQHIRREKATSNICTAQVLLANMASFYAVFHGADGILGIAKRIHTLAHLLAGQIEGFGFQIKHKNFFDTICVQTPDAERIFEKAKQNLINLRKENEKLFISLNECTTLEDVAELACLFQNSNGKSATSQDKILEALHKILNSTNIGLQIPSGQQRTSAFLTHPIFSMHRSETQLMRYITQLQGKDVTLAQSMIPLGSCTMKLNAASELMPLSWKEVNAIHPFAPADQMQGYIEMIRDLENRLCDVTGFSGVSLQPNAGSQGEYAGLLVIRKYLQSKGQGHRNICLIPNSAHGTNPASAVMAGMQVIVVGCDENGNIDVADLEAKAKLHKDKLACLMVTYPSTHGVFEESIRIICDHIHQNGGQVYMDGANLNALVGLCRPGEFGADVCHMNLHKTFAIPHGGGGPGVGPIGVAAHLKPYLPQHSLQSEVGPKTGITATTSAPWGSASILTITWMYMQMMGEVGLKNATAVAILNANYMAKKLNPYFPVLYKGREGLVAHECIIDLRGLKKTSGVDVTDVAKRLMDFGYHAPTMSWPVAGTLMIEPTESESKQELDRFVEAMICIRNEISDLESGKMKLETSPLHNAPHTADMLITADWQHPYTREQAAFPRPWVKAAKYWPVVGRVDNAYGDRNVVCSCPPLEEYEQSL